MKQLKCPSCGAGMSLNSPYEIVVECPYCHSQVINESAYQSKDNSVEPTVFPFCWTEDEVMKSFSDHLIGLQGSSTDIFVKMQIVSINKYYVPMYIFQGSFRAPWTAKVPRQQKRVGVDKDGIIKEIEEIVYDYVNGEAVGNFTYNSVPEKEVQDIGIDLSTLQNLRLNTAKCIPLSSLKIKQEDNIKYLSPSGNADDVWNESAQAMAQDEAYAAAMNQIPKTKYSQLPSLMRKYMELHGHRVEIVNCSASCEMRKATLVFIPIWRIDYEYEKRNYYFISYAEQEGINTSIYPKENKIQANATSEQQDQLDAYKNEITQVERFTGVGCISLFIVEILTVFGITSFFDSLKDAHYGWYFPVAGLVVLILYFIIDNSLKSKYGINDINADITSRTKKMVQTALDYKKQTSERFLKSKAWENTTPIDASDLTSAFVSNFASLQTPDEPNEPNPQVSSLHDSTTSNNIQLNSNTKYCKHCGKKIDVGHTFCRYCGTKQ